MLALWRDRDGFWWVGDYKFAGEDREAGARHDAQLSIYALAHEAQHGRLPDELALHFLESGIVGRVAPSSKRLEKAAEQVAQARVWKADGVRDAEIARLLAEIYRTLGVVERGHLVETDRSGLVAGFVGLGSPGLGVLLQRRLGINLPKADRLTDWLRRPLSGEALGYAAADVAHLDALWDSLRTELDRRGRLAWALDECDTTRRRYRDPADPDVAWWRIKEARRLRGKARGVAQCVAARRENRARQPDRREHRRPPVKLLPVDPEIRRDQRLVLTGRQQPTL